MENTTKSNVLKVLRIAVFSNVNYHYVYESKFFNKFSVQVKSFSTMMEST